MATKTIHQMAEEIQKMLDAPNVVFNDVRPLMTELEARITGVASEPKFESMPKTKAALAEEVEALRTRLTRAAKIFAAAKMAIRYRAGERAAFRRRQLRESGESI